MLPGIDVIDHAKFDSEAKIAALPETLSLRGRRLEGAVFVSARLRKVDFTGAYLQGAAFLRADLRGARFDCEETPSQGCVDLRGASFFRAQLQGVYFDGAELEGVDFFGAQLQGASFNDAQLQGASLERAQLDGAWFRNAQLQGVPLTGAQVRNTFFLKAFVWGTDPPRQNEGIRVIAPETAPRYQGLDCVARGEAFCPWSASSFGALKAVIDHWVAPEDRARALERIAVLAPVPQGLQKPNLGNEWIDLAQRSAGDKKSSDNLVKDLQDLSCKKPGALYVLHGVAHNFRARLDSDNSPRLQELPEIFLDAKQCEGTSGLSERNKFDLQEIIAKTIRS